MPNTLPVPSKGALRLLRHLALGTSCTTVALGAGLLTEDRRRRIHAARKVCDNARKLKSLRQYHSARAAVKEDLEDFIGISDELRLPYDLPEPTIHIEEIPKIPQARSPAAVLPKLPNVESQSLARRLPDGPKGVRQVDSPLTSSSPDASGAAGYNRQLRLARDVDRILRPTGDLDTPLNDINIVAASDRVLDVFKEGIETSSSGLEPVLMYAVVGLIRNCLAHERVEKAAEILRHILDHGPVDAETLKRLQPWRIVSRLLEGPVNEITGQKSISLSKVVAAHAVYMKATSMKAILNSSNQHDHAKILNIGKSLCAVLCQHKEWQRTVRLCSRIEHIRGTSANLVLGFHITALHGLNTFKSCVKLLQVFREKYVMSSPIQQDFSHVTNLVMDAMANARLYAQGEDLLFLFIAMAERLDLKVHTANALFVLGQDWRLHKDISKNKALFNRIEPKLHLMVHFMKMYATIIQHCIEAGDDTTAQFYFEKVDTSYDLRSSIMDAKILGSFAYAKAMKNDWAGVRADFRKMLERKPDMTEYNLAFTPVFRLFAKSHSVTATEEFLREFIQDFKIKLTTATSNIIINLYLKNKEVESTSRWIDFMLSTKTRMDPGFLNTVLQHCSKSFKFDQSQIFGLYFEVSRASGLASRAINNETLSILRRIAVQGVGYDRAKASKRLAALDRMIVMPTNYVKSPVEVMSEAIIHGDVSQAVQIYDSCMNYGVPMHPNGLSLAVKAAFLAKPAGTGIDGVASLVNDACMSRETIGALHQIFVYQISRASCVEDIRRITRNAILSLERSGERNINPWINYPMSVLVRNSQYQEALNFWNAISTRKDNPPLEPRIGDLTIILQAYVGLRNTLGLDWVLRMIIAKDLTVDKHFKETLGKKCQEERKNIKSSGRDPEGPAGAFLRHLVHILNVVKSMRQDEIKEKQSAYRPIYLLLMKVLRAQALESTPLSDSKPQSTINKRSDRGSSVVHLKREWSHSLTGERVTDATWQERKLQRSSSESRRGHRPEFSHASEVLMGEKAKVWIKGQVTQISI